MYRIPTCPVHFFMFSSLVANNIATCGKYAVNLPATRREDLKNIPRERCVKKKCITFENRRLRCRFISCKAFFCFIPKYEIANFNKRRDGENTALICFVYQQCSNALHIYWTAWVYCFFNPSSRRRLAMPVFRWLEDCNNLRLFLDPYTSRVDKN